MQRSLWYWWWFFPDPGGGSDSVQEIQTYLGAFVQCAEIAFDYRYVSDEISEEEKGNSSAVSDDMPGRWLAREAWAW